MAFGTSGISRINLGRPFAVTSAALTASGEIVVVGNSGGDILVARVMESGDIDTGFGDDHDGDGVLDGYVSHDLGGVETVGRVVVDSSTRINLVGQTNFFSPYTMSFSMRLNDDGSLDSTYGAMWGTPGFSMGCAYATPKDLVVDPVSGRIFTIDYEQGVAPTAQGVLSSYYSDGNTAFVCTPISPSVWTMADTAQAIELQDGDSKTVVAGNTGNDVFVRRYLPASNTNDITFGPSGTATLLHVVVGTPGTVVQASDVAIDKDPAHAHYDKSVIVGNADANLLVARFDSTGGLDGAFAGGAGFRSLNFGGVEWGRSVAIDSLGRILAVGDTNGDSIALARLRVNGNRDNTFGPAANGKVETVIDRATAVKSVLITSQGRILVVGNTLYSAELFLARYLS